MQALGAADEERAFQLGWSRWRRAHQAEAQRCHSARHLRERAEHSMPTAVVAAASRGEVTDAEWTKIQPLVPSQKPSVGRPRHDHRTIVSGILWVLRTAAPWREMPAQFGKWDTAYARYRLWRAEGRWQRIIDALGPDAPLPTPPLPVLSGGGEVSL